MSTGMKPNSPESRAAFEKYLKRRGGKTSKDKRGSYLYLPSAIAWDAWQAALKFAEESKPCTPSPEPN